MNASTRHQTTDLAEFDEDVDILRRLHEERRLSLKSGYFNWLPRFYADEAEVLLANLPPHRGRAECSAAWARLLGRRNATFDLRLLDTVLSLCGSMAYQRCGYSLSFDGPNGKIYDEGKSLVVWRKAEADWKIRVDMMNSNLREPYVDGEN